MIRDLIRYNEVAESKVLESFLNTATELPEAEYLFSHILNASHIWICRIEGVKNTYERFDIHSKEKFHTLHKENMLKLYALAELDLDRIIGYTTSAGTFFEDKKMDILVHLVNHSTYHRGQIALEFRRNAVEPPVTDFIVLKRGMHL